jgi:hypothetical protein
MKIFISLLSLLLSLSTPPKQPSIHLESLSQENQVQQKLALVQKEQSTQERLTALSDLFLQRRYQLDPLGEGADTSDSDPLYRFDAFDCATFVETVIALHQSDDFAEFFINMLVLRYNQEFIRDDTRTHLVETQWLPNASRAGFVRDITSQIGNNIAQTAIFSTNSAVLAPKYKLLHTRIGNRWPQGIYQLSYLPIDWASKHTEEIPAGTVLQIVRTPKQGTPHVVSHQGIVLEVEGRKVLRNASSTPRHMRVLDYDLAAYLKSAAKRPHAWRIIGINILQIEAKK